MSILEVKNLKKSFDRESVLKDISFTLEKGECLVILGNSGSGKSIWGGAWMKTRYVPVSIWCFNPLTSSPI